MHALCQLIFPPPSTVPSPPYERTGERVRITDVGDGVLDVPHTATTKRPAFAGLLVYIIQLFFPCCAFMRRS